MLGDSNLIKLLNIIINLFWNRDLLLHQLKLILMAYLKISVNIFDLIFNLKFRPPIFTTWRGRIKIWASYIQLLFLIFIIWNIMTFVYLNIVSERMESKWVLIVLMLLYILYLLRLIIWLFFFFVLMIIDSWSYFLDFLNFNIVLIFRIFILIYLAL